MAAIIEGSLRPCKKKSHLLKIDMTPMVDLGFLLITFFIFTTSMAEPRVTKLVMPADGKPSPVAESKIITAILDKDKIMIYEGMFENAATANSITETDYNVKTGLGQFIRQKQNSMNDKKDELMVAIKPLPGASYQNVLNALDEMQINQVSRYAIVNLSGEEERYVATKAH